MFFVRTDNPITTAKTIDTSYKPSSKLLILSDEDSKEITTRQLGSLVQSKSDGLIDQFISYAKQDGSKLTITYQDEHLKSIMGMVLTIQTIEHIVKQIGSNFSIEYKVESYRDDRGNAESITANQPSSEKRDGWLTNLTNAWLDDLRCDDDIDGDLVPVESVAKRTLTHWRVLSIKCGNKQLSIYPDGGFINEWSIGYNKHLDVQTITYDTVINIFRNKEIKFDIIIEDC